MKIKNDMLTAAGLLVVMILSGCGESTRPSGAQRRWERVITQARIDAANQSIEQGRLEYAQALLEELVDSESAFSPQAAEALDQLRLVTTQFAQARSEEGLLVN